MTPPLELLLAKVDITVDGCWLWLGATTTAGYGVTNAGLAHRLTYEYFIGPIPEDRLLDHVCRNPSCVRPDHLDVVTHRENVLRGVGVTAVNALKTECDRGHAFTEANTRIWRGRRVCRACDAAKKAQRRKAS